MSNEFVSRSMCKVFLYSYPFKVFYGVIRFVTVNMIYLWLVFRIRNIQFRNNAVDKIFFVMDTETIVSSVVFPRLYFPAITFVKYIAGFSDDVIFQCKRSSSIVFHIHTP